VVAYDELIRFSHKPVARFSKLSVDNRVQTIFIHGVRLSCDVNAAEYYRNGKTPMVIDTSPYHDSPESAVNDYLQSLILESQDIGEFLDGLAHFSAQSLSTAGDEVLCGITLLRDRKAATVASSSEYARKMDEIQYSFGDGPCMTASREQITIHVPDLHVEQRWPEYAATVLEHGVRSILAVPFNLEGDARAALNLYSEQIGRFDSSALEKAETYTMATSKPSGWACASRSTSTPLRTSGRRWNRGPSSTSRWASLWPRTGAARAPPSKS
jgi:putative methionine-R-sulfoxide reductase with GAF domain